MSEPPAGSVDNYRMFIQLVEAGAPPLSQSRDVLQLATVRGLTRIATAFQYLETKNSKQLVRRCSLIMSYLISFSARIVETDLVFLFGAKSLRMTKLISLIVHLYTTDKIHHIKKT